MSKTASLQSRMVNRSLKNMVQVLFDKGLKLDKLRKDDFPEPGPYARRKCHAETYEKEGIQGTWLYPRKSDYRGTILYFHGGAYVSGPSLLHWRLTAYLCRAAGYRSLLINYPKAPESPYPAAIETMESVYLDLLAESKGEEILFMGDSAGGGLALALMMKLRDENKALPAKAALLSPWLDLTLSDDDIALQAEKDHMLAIPGLKEAADFYRNSEELKHPLISPLYGDLTGLPPIFLQVGTLELILPQCRRFRRKAKDSGLDLRYEEWEEMFHVWMLNIPYLPEAKEAVSRLLDWL